MAYEVAKSVGATAQARQNETTKRLFVLRSAFCAKEKPAINNTYIHTLVGTRVGKDYRDMCDRMMGLVTSSHT